jgi:predicted transcriptional regulator
MSTVLTIRVDDQIKSELESLAERTQRSKSFLASEALKDYLARESMPSGAHHGRNQASAGGTDGFRRGGRCVDGVTRNHKRAA